MRLRFSEFVFDSDSRRLTRGGEPIHLEPKAFELLELLLERRPAAVAKSAIRDRLWPRTFVSESSLTTLAAQLRRALGEADRFVRTVHGFGYAFEGEAHDLDLAGAGAVLPAFVCRIAWKDRVSDLPPGESFIGRAPGVAIQIQDDRVSRRHARIRVGAAGATLQDLDSRNGTYLRGERIQGEVPLADGDEIRIGQDRLVVRLIDGETSTMTSVDSALGTAPSGGVPPR
jgi:DNA-binding winged helix-turn-helix (wHTH) protein